MDELFDENIKQVAEAIAVHDLTVQSNFSAVSSQKRTTLKGEEEFLIQIWNGEKLFYSSLPAQDFPHQKPGGVKTVHFNGQKWRYYGLQHANTWLIQVSQPIPLRHTVIWEIYFELLIPLLIQFPIITGLIWLVLRRGFQPLSRISSSIERRDATYLGKLTDKGIPEEVSVMVDALNGLLGRLGQALSTQRQFTADAAHELRTPLTAVRLELDLLKRADTEAERKQSIEKLFSAVDRCIRLVQQLLELARQEPDLPEELMTTVSLATLVRDAVSDIETLIRRKNIDLAVEMTGDVIVKGQLKALSTMIANLLDNAVLYTQESGNIKISIRKENGRVILTIADNGPGIPLAEHSRIFDRFYRVINDHTSHVIGSGLGLAIVRAIADRHSAKIDITKGLQNKGIAFEITFSEL